VVVGNTTPADVYRPAVINYALNTVILGWDSVVSMATR